MSPYVGLRPLLKNSSSVTSGLDTVPPLSSAERLTTCATVQQESHIQILLHQEHRAHSICDCPSGALQNFVVYWLLVIGYIPTRRARNIEAGLSGIGTKIFVLLSPQVQDLMTTPHSVLSFLFEFECILHIAF